MTTIYLKLEFFSYLTGEELLHVIALLSKDVRKCLPGAGLLN